MAETPSSMVPLGTSAPDFTLLDVISDEEVKLSDIKSTLGTVVMFICNHCPYVKHINEELVALSEQYEREGICFVAISSNDAESYPEDSPEKMKEYAQQLGYPFPYFYDETQEVAREFQATCTPDFFVYNSAMKLVYRGQLDDSRPGGRIPVTGVDLRLALDSVIRGEVVHPDQHPSMGCNIKWKA